MRRKFLEEGNQIYNDFLSYQDCSEAIRKSLSDGTQQSEQIAFDAVKENVAMMYRIYNNTKALTEVFAEILSTFAEQGDEKSAVQENQATARVFCDILSFVLRFDEAKMRTPGLQNDFSFYRRNLAKHANEDLVVRDQEANYVSLFFAPASPIMYNVAGKIGEIISANNEHGNGVKTLLSTIANVCLHLVKTEASNDEQINQLCVRAMVGAIVLYDSAVPTGAFGNQSGINIKGAVQLVCKNYPNPRTLVNALKYSTVHLSDNSACQAMLDELD